MKSPLRFYFFSCRTAIRYHIAQHLIALGGEQTNRPEEAHFKDNHLILDDAVSKHLEYKHLLAQFMERFVPGRMPLTYYLNEQNYHTVFSKIIYSHYLTQEGYQKNTLLKWILKPSMMNNAEGIKLFEDIEAVKRYYQQFNRFGGDHVLQQYLLTPDLINKRKYTFRIPVIFTNFAGVFLYRKGYVNICSQPFLSNDFTEKRAHITNYVIDGELTGIEQRHTDNIENFPIIYEQIEELVSQIAKGMVKAYPNYLKPSAVQKFEIFGFDFILDDKKKLWLLEVNQGPDAPMFEENPLKHTLWEDFWKYIIGDFVLPIATQSPPQYAYEAFSLVLPKEVCYSRLHAWVKRWLVKN